MTFVMNKVLDNILMIEFALAHISKDNSMGNHTIQD